MLLVLSSCLIWLVILCVVITLMNILNIPNNLLQLTGSECANTMQSQSVTSLSHSEHTGPGLKSRGVRVGEGSEYGGGVRVGEELSKKVRVRWRVEYRGQSTGVRVWGRC